ncbi:MAG TPA: polyprenol phosphomannose-dependent alpha 1,6 mannosyltransferase MptB [Nocardioidaceae bacterium]|nr:polyprenol phosphomannose-dependent alpha 1,6 mannosyltransferase MptB [Nocardioidaceae bacterium]
MLLCGASGYVLVLLGGLVVSVVPESSAVGQLPVVGFLRETTLGRMVGLGVTVVGLGIAAATWLRLVRYVARTSAEAPDRLWLVRRATFTWCVPLLLAPAMFSRDGWSYAAQGELTRLGISPYVWGPSVLDGPIVEAVDPRWMDTPTPYGPVPLFWGALAASVSGDPWFLVVAHRLLALVGLVMLAYAVPRLASWAGRDGAAASALVLPSPLVLVHGVAGVHNDVLMAGLMALALVVAIENSWILGAVLGGAAAAVKLPGGLVCIGVALVSLPLLSSSLQRARRLAVVAGVAVAALIGAGMAAGVGVGWVHALGVPGEVQTPFSMTTQVGRLLDLVLGAVPVPLGLDLPEGTAVAALRWSGSATALLLAARVAFRARTRVPAAGVRAVALVMAALVALSPVVHHWYALWCVPLLATCRLGRRSAAVLLHLSWLLGVVAPLDSSLEGRGSTIAVGLLLVGGVAVALALGHRAATSDDRSSPRSTEGVAA